MPSGRPGQCLRGKSSRQARASIVAGQRRFPDRGTGKLPTRASRSGAGDCSKPNICAVCQTAAAAVLSCYTRGASVRILALTCGAMGIRTPDLLHAIRRQHIHPRPSPQVSVPERLPWSASIRTGCGTSVLYSPPRSMALQRPCALAAAAPRNLLVTKAASGAHGSEGNPRAGDPPLI